MVALHTVQVGAGPIAAAAVEERRTDSEVDTAGSALEVARSLVDTVAVDHRALAAISTCPKCWPTAARPILAQRICTASTKIDLRP